ncbi:MAG: ECF transporter S component [Anaeromassilibacillus sp.]
MFQTQHRQAVRLTTTALCIALGLLLPTVFHVFGTGAGTALLPMHLPVLLCGLLCGWQYGAACGILVPLFSSILTGMPPIFPTGASMMVELCAYGVLTGLFYQTLHQKLYVSLVGAMLGGRVIYGLVNAVFMGVAGKPYGFAAFLSGAFLTAWPGILLQLIVVPLLVFTLQKSGLWSRTLRQSE